MKWVWLDLETTGLDEKRDEVLAAGVRITDVYLKPLAEIEVYRNFDRAAFPEVKISDVVAKMHETSGVWARCKDAILTLNGMEDVLREFLAFNLKGEKGYLAGNSIHFDRRFLAAQMSPLLGFVSHRMLDVSVFKVLAEGWNLGYDQGEPTHTPLADIDSSIAQLKSFVGQHFHGNPLVFR